MYNNKILKTLVVNNDYDIHSNKVIHHFSGGLGVYQNIIYFMTIFLNDLKDFTINNNINKTKLFKEISYNNILRMSDLTETHDISSVVVEPEEDEHPIYIKKRKHMSKDYICQWLHKHKSDHMCQTHTHPRAC